MLGLKPAMGFDEAHEDFGASDFAGLGVEQHGLFGFAVAFSASMAVQQEAVASGSEGASVASPPGCVAAIAPLVISVDCSVGATSGLKVGVSAFFGLQQPAPHAMLRI
jgi:hypothetical protein